MRYHSLISDPESIPAELEIEAWTTESQSEIMAVRHRRHPTWGVQFHPESIGTGRGRTMLQNFLNMARTSRQGR
jgi:anthranilate/para-aminobenzoate synthase component II